MAFADHYPLAAFAAIADAAWWRSNDFSLGKGEYDRDAYQIAIDADQADRKRVEAHKEVLSAAIEAHLVELRAEGRLGRAGGLGGRDIFVATAWNDLVDGKEGKWSRTWLLKSLATVWTRAFVEMDKGRHSRKREESHVRGSHQEPTAEQVEAAWTSICQQFDAGNSLYEDGQFGRWEIEANDQITGNRCQLHFLDWKAVVMKFDENYRLQPVADVAEQGIVVADVEMPSGRMMLTDVLRIEAFDKGTEFSSDRDYDELSLGSVLGRNNRMIAHAAEHQIGYTQTANTSVAVWRDAKGRILVTERWSADIEEDENGENSFEGWERVGSFSCDVWRVMAFDRDTAIARIRDGGAEDAEADLDRYLAMATATVEPGDHKAHHESCYAANIVTLDVEPGTWRIHGGENFDKLADRKSMELPEKAELWCLLEQSNQK